MKVHSDLSLRGAKQRSNPARSTSSSLDMLGMTLSKVEWVRAPSKVEGLDRHARRCRARDDIRNGNWQLSFAGPFFAERPFDFDFDRKMMPPDYSRVSAVLARPWPPDDLRRGGNPVVAFCTPHSEIRNYNSGASSRLRSSATLPRRWPRARVSTFNGVQWAMRSSAQARMASTAGSE